MIIRLLQCNLNDSWAAQDILRQEIVDRRIGICAIAEPRTVPENDMLWFASGDGKSAINWRPEELPNSCSLLFRGNSFVSVKCGDLHVYMCYVSPSVNLGVFLEFLNELGDALIQTRGKTLVCGDFNSKSPL